MCPSPAGKPRRVFHWTDANDGVPDKSLHVIWWDEEEESESDVRLRVERMIAQGKAHPEDRFFYVSWRR